MQADRPAWCGICDEHTRLLDMGHCVARCPDCHPLRRRMLPQHRKCPQCHMTISAWDHAPCGRHAGPVPVKDRRPDRQRIREIVGAVTDRTGNGHGKTPPGNWASDFVERDEP